MTNAGDELDLILGNYENHVHDSSDKNDWHYITITRINETTLKWTNRAGVQWALTATPDAARLAVGSDCPYYTTGYKEATVVWEGNRLKGLIGPADELYESTQTITRPSPVPAPESADRRQAINEIIRLAGKIQLQPEEKIDGGEEVSPDGGSSTKQVTIIENSEDILNWGNNDDIVFPGALIKGSSLPSYAYETVSLARAPYTISIDLGTGNTGKSVTQIIPDGSVSSYQQGFQDLLKNSISAQTQAPLQSSFSYETVYDENQMSLAVGANVKYGPVSLKTSFNFSDKKIKTRLIAKYTQVYFTVNMSPPPTADGFFADSVSVNDVQIALPPGSLPVYVSSAKYGIMALLMIESSYSEMQVKGALDASYKGVGSASIQLAAEQQKVIANTKISVLIYGGSTQAAGAITTFDEFKELVKSSTTFGPTSPGLPLFYKFRHVNDKTIAAVALTSTYAIVTPLRQKVRVTVTQFLMEKADDEGTDNEVEMDRLGVWVQGFNRKSQTDPGTPAASTPTSQCIYYFSSKGDGWQTGTGGVKPIDSGNTFDVEFDTNPKSGFDLDFAQLVLSSYGRDYDAGSANEDGNGTITINASQFGQDVTFPLGGSDFEIKVTVNLQTID